MNIALYRYPRHRRSSRSRISRFERTARAIGILVAIVLLALSAAFALNTLERAGVHLPFSHLPIISSFASGNSQETGR